jgi:hypothetical protein
MPSSPNFQVNTQLISRPANKTMIAGVSDSSKLFTMYDITIEATTDAISIVREPPVSASFALQDKQLKENRRVNQRTLAAEMTVSHWGHRRLMFAAFLSDNGQVEQRRWPSGPWPSESLQAFAERDSHPPPPSAEITLIEAE